ncbi:MAG: O-antigen ligase family protein [Deltaproteobacteria bacterium]|nr:O-antigen ligase family protein [Deltaproteobacteria bacterium]
MTALQHPTVPSGDRPPHGLRPPTHSSRLDDWAGRARAARRWLEPYLRAVLPPLMLALLWLETATIVLDRFPLPWGHSFGFRSLARNVAIAVVLGHLAGAPALQLVRATLAAPLLAYLGAAFLSVAVNGEFWGEVRLLGVSVAFYVATRTIAAHRPGSVQLLHWLGILVTLQLLREFLNQPQLLLLREDLRNTLVSDHPNSVGYTLAVLLPLFLGVALGPSGKSLPKLYALLAPLGLLITFSRSAWATAVLGVLVMLVALRRRMRTARQTALLFGTVALATVVVLSVISLSSDRTHADLQRLRILNASLSLFHDHWLVGVGFGGPNFKDAFPARYLEMYGEGLFLFHSHNAVVEVLACTGLVGAAAAAWLVWRLGRLARRALHAAPAASSSEGIGMAVSIAVFLVMGLFDVPATHPKLMLVFAATLAFIETRTEELERAHETDVAQRPA